MKKFRTAFLSAIAVFLVLNLCGCTVNITIGGKDKEISGISDTKSDQDAVEFIEAAPVTNASGAVVAPNAKAIRASKALKVYKEAVGRIKTDSVGFKKTQWQDFNGINTGEPTGIANMVLTIVSKNVIKNNTKTDAERNAEVFRSNDISAIRENFPLFGYDFSYVDADSTDYITGAEYEKKDGYKEYYIYFADALNPVMGEQGFGGIMTPFDRNLVLDGIKDYVWNVKKDSLKFDCTYKGSYLMFRVNNNGELIYLEQNLYAEIDAKAELDLIVAETNFLNGKCSYEEHYIYSDFTY